MELYAGLDEGVSIPTSPIFHQQDAHKVIAYRFPGHKPKDHKFSIWSESFGGHYGPTFANFFEKQNAAIAKGNISDAITMKLDTVGIINGCVDILTQIPAYPQMAFNNTYGLKAINETEYKAALDSFPACQKSVMACRTLADAKDPLSRGNNADVNKACSDAFKLCFGTMARGVQDRQVGDTFLSRYHILANPACRGMCLILQQWSQVHFHQSTRQDTSTPERFSSN